MEIKFISPEHGKRWMTSLAAKRYLDPAEGI
jgi:hypothetical protein